MNLMMKLFGLVLSLKDFKTKKIKYIAKKLLKNKTFQLLTCNNKNKSIKKKNRDVEMVMEAR